MQYKLTDDEVKKLMTEKFKNTGKKNSTKNAVSIDERLAILNNVIKADFSDKITRDQLNTKDYVSIHLTPEKEKELFSKDVATQQYMSTSDIIDLKTKEKTTIRDILTNGTPSESWMVEHSTQTKGSIYL